MHYLATPISFKTPEDNIVWSGNNSGTYTAKDGFSLLIQRPHLIPNPFWKFLWSINIPPKYQLFTWKLLQLALPAGDILNHHHLNCSLLRLTWCEAQDSLQHVFFQCPRARALWWCTLNIRAEWQDFEAFSSWLKLSLQALANDNFHRIVHQIIFLLHRPWESRNHALHDGPPHIVPRDMQHILYFSNFHDLIAGPNGKGKEIDAHRQLGPSYPQQGYKKLNRTTDWIILMQRCPTLPSKPCFTIMVEKTTTFSQVWNPKHDTILKDIRTMLDVFTTTSFCGLKDKIWAQNRMESFFKTEDPDAIFLV